MLPITILALLGISMLMMGDNDTPEVEDDPDDETGAYALESGQTVVGTDGDDVFNLVEDTRYEDGPLSISAGAGNDSIDLLPYDANRVDIDAGEGDDFIRFRGDGLSTIDAGAGDDEVVIFDGAATVYGGEGRDVITSDSANRDHSEFYGGAGDDVLYGDEMNSFGLFGGEGDDVLMTSQHANAGSGYWAQADGGEGDDRLIHAAQPQYDGLSAMRLAGGEGNDSFEISFTEALEIPSENDDSTLPIVSEFVVIEDFEVGVDQLQIDAMISDDDYTVTSAQLVEDTDAGETTLTVTYDHDTDPSREMVITLNATDVTWDDITFVGDNVPPVLVPV